MVAKLNYSALGVACLVTVCLSPRIMTASLAGASSCLPPPFRLWVSTGIRLREGKERSDQRLRLVYPHLEITNTSADTEFPVKYTALETDRSVYFQSLAALCVPEGAAVHG